ncbi:transcription elongation factor GreB [Kistimonas asteriae]|uniref:transcription elongation factor GreB n=1 Tax=Kistimonas asteriae TaxID=517724 RepID=UPI001BA6EE0F|nr:transcription elongation factor GreB [Kistimonas asteriae]
MSRYRPSRKPGSFYITPEGYTTLKDELDYLWRTQRPQVTQAVSEAAALGDRSENAEYIYGKKLLRQIDSRVRFLRKRLDQLTVVTTLPEDTSRVYFGAWVTVEDGEGIETTWRVVGPDEFDLKNGLLSMDSPLARALMGKTIDDEIVILVEEKETCYCIISITYHQP